MIRRWMALVEVFGEGEELQQLEAWLRGPVEAVPPELMPVAHALVQAVDDADRLVSGIGEEDLWLRPAGAASVGFHLRHIAGVVDRLLTYARGEELSTEQLDGLRAEAEPGDPPATAGELLRELRAAVDRALAQLRNTPVEALLEPRGVGRKKIPSNVLGLLSHAGEHAQRHVGQIVVTTKVIRGVPRHILEQAESTGG